MNKLLLKNMLMHLVFVALASLFFFSCDSMKSEGLKDGSINFSGVNSIQYTQDGKYIISWDQANSNEKILYYVYFQDLGEIEGDVAGKPLELTGSARNAIVTNKTPELDPTVLGQLLDTLESSSLNYQLEIQLKPNHVYGFFVKAKSTDGKEDSNSSVLLLNKNSSGEYIGCLDVKALNSNEIQINVEYPNGTNEVNIFRNNILVSTIDSPVSNVFIDKKLEIEKDYQYRCEAQAGNDVLVGSNQPTLKTLNPFSDYLGCVSADIDGRNIEIQFQYPDNAKEANIYRDGILVHTSTSSAGIKYVDVDMVPGETYDYSCEAHVDGIAGVGSQKLKVRVPDSLATFNGCLDAKALGASDIRIEFQIPNNVDELVVYRNGVKIYSTNDKTQLSYIDNGLSEGLTYRYNCAAVLGNVEKVGDSDFSVTTISTNAPIFSGISEVNIKSATEAEVKWGVTSSDGVAAESYNIYANVGNLVDWGGQPFKSINAGAVKNLIENLGDELPYAFGVRACSKQGICDANTVMIRESTPDNGAPTTVGAESVEVKNGKLVIYAPWKHSNGAVLKRKIYLRVGDMGGLNLDNYVLQKTIVTDDISNPPKELEVGGISENTKYHVIVVDEDPSGQSNVPTSYLTVETGDLTAPSFTGIAGLKLGEEGKESTTMKVEFNAIDFENSANPDGARSYLIYLLGEKGNACKEGLLYDTVAANLFVSGELSLHTIKGLKEKSLYTVCIKAVDEAGNISNSSTYLSRYTLDTTIPNFDGVQTVEYNPATGKVDVSWNASSAKDVMEYKIKVWKNAQAPNASQIETFVKNAIEYKTGFSFSQNDFFYVGNDYLYVLVDACDNAHLIPDGSQNCTTSAIPFAYQMPDVTPPQGFMGVQGSSMIYTPAEGEVSVYWKQPEGAVWTDYRGFKIFHVHLHDGELGDDDLEFLADCPCTADDCPDNRLSCDITGLVPYKTYNFHVRAYDAVGNITSYLNPKVYTTSKRTTDTTMPVFSSGLTAGYDQSAVHLAWGNASDNQYPGEPDSAIHYLVYRRAGSSFTVATDPLFDNDTILLATLNENIFADDKLESNVDYYYSICASDASNNVNCDGSVRKVSTPDVIPPEVLNISSNKEEDKNLKVWNLSWQLKDNSDLATLRVTLKSYISDSEIPPESYDSYNMTITSDEGITSESNLVGVTNENKWIHYLLVIQDLAGNKGYGTYSLYSQNKVEVNNVKKASGPTSGNKFIVIEGAGFSDGATIKIGGDPCNSVEYYTTSKMGCRTPSKLAGSYTVTVTNPASTGFASLPNAYTYYETGDVNLTLCDLPENQGINFVRDTITYSFPAGNGTSAEPFIICNGEQLDKLRALGHTQYLKLGDNIDLASFNNNDFLPLSFAGRNDLYRMNFDGDGLYIANWSYKVPGENNIGLFMTLVNNAMVKNLNLVNFDVEGNSTIGLLTNYIDRYSCSTIVQNVSVHGDLLVHHHYAGGVAGRIIHGGLSNITTDVNLVADFAQETSYRSHYGTVAGSWERRCAGSNIHGKGSLEFTSSYNVGGLFGWTHASVTNCSFQGKLLGHTPNSADRGQIGGIVGSMASGSDIDRQSFDGCHVDVIIDSEHQYVGGFAGTQSTNSEIINSSVKGRVKGVYQTGGFVGRFVANVNPALKNNLADVKVESPSNFVGGMIGWIDGHPNWSHDFTIEKNEVKGSVQGNENVGGFIGYMECHIGQCSDQAIFRQNKSSADVTAMSDNVGGFVGQARSVPETIVMSQNIATGNVKGKKCSGGFVGYNLASIEDSYASGDILSDDYGATFAGCVANYTSYAASVINRSYASGVLEKGIGTRFGGFTSYDGRWSSPVYQNEYSANFWNTEVSGMDSTYGDESQIFGVNTQLMETQATYEGVGWDFNPIGGVWVSPFGGGYPKLSWEVE